MAAGRERSFGPWPPVCGPVLLVAALCAFPVGAAVAQQGPSNAELLKRIEALQRRVDELEGRRKPAAPAASKRAAAKPAAAAPGVETAAAPAVVPRPANADEVADAVLKRISAGSVPGLLPPEAMGNPWEESLVSDLPGIAIRIPGGNTEVRLYGWAKLSAYADLNGRNQTDAPPVQTIPLSGSANDRQGGDFSATPRFSRVGIDTRSKTDWGTFETRLEGDFGGGPATSTNFVFRLRQAWAELGDERFRVLIGQANSLWNEGNFETLIDATNLNQSFIRQAQVRVTGRLAPGVTGMVSLEAPETQFTTAGGVFNATSTPDGGATPSFSSVPDLLGRLTYERDGLEVVGRAMLRQISVRTAGTSLAPPATIQNTTGYGFAANVRFPMRWLSAALGPDQLIGMAYYGEGIGRYFAGNTSGQDALSNIGLTGVGNEVTVDPVPTYGAVLAYRRWWKRTLRSNFAISYAKQDFPGYARGFAPGSAAAVSLNREMQQAFVNLIWSPFATERNGVVGNGWLDVGIEYLYSRRDVLGGAAATGSAGVGHGVANRFVGAAIARF